MEHYDAECSERKDGGIEDDKQDLECYDAEEHPALMDPRQGVEHDRGEVSECDDAKCLKRDDDVTAGKTCAATEVRTCDTTTTDSINQTSDSSFPICNIARDRKVIGSLSAVGAPTTSVAANNVGESTSPPEGECGTSSTSSSRDIDAGDFDLNDQVTSGTRHVVGEDHWCDFMWREEKEKEQQEQQQDSAEVLDDTCRDSAHCRSTSINIKLESCVLATTSLIAASQDAASERLLEQQSSMPNNVDIYRSILKDAAETENPSEDVVVDDTPRLRNDPTILVTPYDETCVNLDKSDADELIFCITDISTDGTSVEDELSPGVTSRCSPNDVSKVIDSYFELPMTTTTSTATTLLIGHPNDVHRNSQDSGIDETTMTIDDSVVGDAQPLPPTRGSLQESVDSGIESECSSICIRMDSAVERGLEVVVTSKKLPREDGNMGDDEDDDDGGGGGGGDCDDGDVDFGKFASDFLTQEVRLVDNDSVSGIACSYLSSIKCAVVSAARPVAEMASSGAVGVVVADEGVARPSAAPVIAHSPATVHGTR